MGNLADETLEWELADEELGRLLIATDLTKSDGTFDGVRDCAAGLILV